MARLDLSAESLGMLYLHCNEMEKEFVLEIETKSYIGQSENIRNIVLKTNKYLDAFKFLIFQIMDNKPEEYNIFFNSEFKQNIDTLYKSYDEKYSMYREYFLRTQKENK